jgi:hypothetical protein
MEDSAHNAHLTRLPPTAAYINFLFMEPHREISVSRCVVCQGMGLLYRHNVAAAGSIRVKA